VGPIKLSIADIEFVAADEILLDDDDVIVVDERRLRARERARTDAPARTRQHTAPLPAPYGRVFDDATTRVWSPRMLVAR
jgi:hypothetical protein